MIITSYAINAGHEVKIAFVADLHEKKSKDVVKLIKKISPDLILVGGDVFERHGRGEDPKLINTLYEEGSLGARLMHLKYKMYYVMKMIIGDQKHHHTENAYNFFKYASEIAPVILSVGNHEWYYEAEDLEVLDKYGVTLLDNSSIDWNGIEIGGLSPCLNLEWLEEFEKIDKFKILLCHHPEYYPEYLADKNINLVLSGHAHGGQIRIGNQGLLAPGQGFFPKLTKGLYFEHLIVTAGCSNTAKIPRWGNPREVVEINLQNDILK